MKIDETTTGSVEIIPDPSIPEDYETVFEQNYNSAGPAETDLINLYGGNIGATVVDGKLVIPPMSYANAMAILVPNNLLRRCSSDYYLEMDLTIGQKMGVLGFILNTSDAVGTDTTKTTDKINSILVTLRRGNYSNGDLTASADLGFRAGYFDGEGKQTTPVSNDRFAYDVTEDGNASFKLTIHVNGNRVELFVDGKWCGGYDLPEEGDYSVKEKSVIMLWAENTDVIIDNLSVKTKEIVDDEGDGDGEELVGTTVALNNTVSGIKLLDPRMEKTANHITCDWSASGIEFSAVCKGDVVFKVHTNAGCYFRVYVDGNVYKNGDSDYFTVSGNGRITVKDLPEGAHTIKLIKVTGYTLANAELISVTLDGSISDTAPANKDLFIEFVGDSISCGWGVIGGYAGAYTDQDITMAYPYLVAQALGADMSDVALSGKGIILGGNLSITNGYKYASVNRQGVVEYAFARKADVVVINADTNDAYRSTDALVYMEALEAFVSYVREKNPDAHIILVCNMMKENYNDIIGALVKKLGGAEEGYYYYKAEPTADVHSNHPSAEEHAAYAEVLTAMIREILGGTYEEPELDFEVPEAPTTSIPEDYKTVYSQDFGSVTTPEGAGFASLYGGNMGATVVDGKLVIPYAAWKDCRAQLVPNSAFADYASRYLLEMDITFGEKLGVFGLLLNTTGVSENWNIDKVNSHLIMLRRGNGTNGELLASEDIKFLAGYHNASGVQSTPYSNPAFDVTVDGQASFKLSVHVNGNRVDLFVDGEWIFGYDVPSDIDCGIKADSAVILWAEYTNATIDNITVKIDETSTSEPEEPITPPEATTVIPTDKTVIYSQNFDNVSNAADAGITPIYGSAVAPSIVDGKLSIPKTSWGATPPFLSLVGRDVFADCDGAYMIEMDVDVSELGVFGLILNGTTPSESDTQYKRANAFLVSLRLGKGVNMLTHGSLEAKSGDYDIYLRTGFFASDGGQVTDLQNDKLVKNLNEGDKSASVKLTVVVDQSEGGSTVSIFVDGEYIYSFSQGADFNVNENSYVSLWAQDAVFTVDNLVVSKI